MKLKNKLTKDYYCLDIPLLKGWWLWVEKEPCDEDSNISYLCELHHREKANIDSESLVLQDFLYLTGRETIKDIKQRAILEMMSKRTQINNELKEMGCKNLFLKNAIELTDKQKQEVVDLYQDDFYSMNIIDYFCELCPKIVDRVRRLTMKYMGYTKKDWKWACEEINHFDCEASEMIEEVELDTMNTLLDLYDIDTDKDYCEAY